MGRAEAIGGEAWASRNGEEMMGDLFRGLVAKSGTGGGGEKGSRLVSATLDGATPSLIRLAARGFWRCLAVWPSRERERLDLNRSKWTAAAADVPC